MQIPAPSLTMKLYFIKDGDFHEHFVPSEDLVLFNSLEHFLNKCDYYLKHNNKRRQIAANGYGKVKEFHTYEVRLKEIFEVVFS